MIPRVAVLGAAVAVAALSGCATPAPGTTQTESDPADAFSIDQDFPDPDVLRVGGQYYAYATNGAGLNVQVATSSDLEQWEVLDADPLPELPDWALTGKTWAPEVAEIGPASYAMYYTVATRDPQLQCIGVATASDPAGPFAPVGTGPIVCPADQGGAIDASTFVDRDGIRYLLWKNDGNCCGLDTRLQISQLSADGTALVGAVTPLLTQDREWEGDLIEAPTLVERDGVYVLLYSANDYGGDAYATGFATSASVLGPYTKAEQPLLTTEVSGGRYIGPGGQDVVTGPDGTDSLMFHSWDSLYIQRGVNLERLAWTDGIPSLPELD